MDIKRISMENIGIQIESFMLVEQGILTRGIMVMVIIYHGIHIIYMLQTKLSAELYMHHS